MAADIPILMPIGGRGSTVVGMAGHIDSARGLAERAIEQAQQHGDIRLRLSGLWTVISAFGCPGSGT